MIKKYEITWLDENGYMHVLNHITTDKPSNALFNEICKLLVLYPTIFQRFEGMPDNIHKWIKKGNTLREHYFANIGEQSVSCMAES